jgi:hypothetical protein
MRTTTPAGTSSGRASSPTYERHVASSATATPTTVRTSPPKTATCSGLTPLTQLPKATIQGHTVLVEASARSVTLKAGPFPARI